jgi:hypothetical protein
MKGSDTSPTMRGIAVRELLLCDEIPTPMAVPGIDVNEPAPARAGALCKKDRYAAHSALGSGCASCHQFFDPIGFGLENYDGNGRYRTVQYLKKDPDDPEGKSVLEVPSGTAGAQRCDIAGTGEVAGLGTFRGPGELSEVLLKSDKLGRCAVSQLYRFAVGRQKLDALDNEVVSVMRNKSGANAGEFRFDDLLLDFVSEEAFRHRREEQ